MIKEPVEKVSDWAESLLEMVNVINTKAAFLQIARKCWNILVGLMFNVEKNPQFICRFKEMLI